MAKLYKSHKYSVYLAVLFLALGTGAFSTVSAGAAPDPFTTGLLWKVESPGIEPSYVFGTMHVEDERVTRLPQQVKRVFDHSGHFTMEVKLDAMAALQSTTVLLLTDGRTLTSIIGESLFSKAANLIADHGISKPVLDGLKPWAVFVTLSTPKAQSGLFLDKVLLLEAQKQGKSIFGLETVQEQLAVFDEISVADQIVLLRETLDNYDMIPAIHEQLTQAYLARDLSRIMTLNNKYMHTGTQRLADEIMKRLVYDRNVRMVQRMQPQLKKGNGFFAVGALHLPGEKGILRLLQNRGYRLSVIY